MTIQLVLLSLLSFFLLDTYERRAGMIAFCFYVGGVLGFAMTFVGTIHYSTRALVLYAGYLVLATIIFRLVKKRAAARDGPQPPNAGWN